jgi:hypothetical protein
MSNTNLQNIPPVPVQDAATETAAWRTFISSVTNDPKYLINGFFIPLSDISNTIQYAATGFRVYGAIKEDGTFHLYVVAVDANGDDVLVDGNQGSLVFDSTCPCPNMCGGGNVLNGNQ